MGGKRTALDGEQPWAIVRSAFAGRSAKLWARRRCYPAAAGALCRLGGRRQPAVASGASRAAVLEGHREQWHDLVAETVRLFERRIP